MPRNLRARGPLNSGDISLCRPLVVITVPLRQGRAVLEWAKAEIAPLAALLGAAIFALGFGLLAEEVFEGSAANS